MEAILRNLASIHLFEFCRNNGISPNGYEHEGTHVVKNRRGVNGKQFFSLVSNETGQAIVTVTFHKNHVPTYSVHKR